MTLRELVHYRMNELGIKPKRSLGQNFLISDHVLYEINKKVEEYNPPFIVEVGPGLGVLTESIMSSGRPYLLIEMDTEFCRFWRARTKHVVEMDALKFDWETQIKVPGTLLLANLPYQIGGRLVIEVTNKAPAIDKMILMFQKEVAQRMGAEPQTKDYGMLSVVMQAHWKIKKVVDAPSADFYPAPKVDSRVLSFERFKSEEKLGVSFTAFVKQAFQFRRKFMVKSFNQDKGLIEEALEELGYKRTVRAEEISVNDFKALFLMYMSRKTRAL